MSMSKLTVLRPVLSALVLAAAVGSAPADTGYDRRLAEAAASIVAERMGPLRGRIDADRRAMPPAQASEPAAARPAGESGPRPGEWRNGLALAIEHRRDVSPDL